MKARTYFLRRDNLTFLSVWVTRPVGRWSASESVRKTGRIVYVQRTSSKYLKMQLTSTNSFEYILFYICVFLALH